MRFMMIVKASPDSEAGKLPGEELLSAMGKYNQELMKAGVLIDLAGLYPTSKSSRIKFTKGKPAVIDGPFAETRELIGGYWLINVKSKAEAIEWALRAPAPHGPAEDAEIEIRQIFDPEEFLSGPPLDRQRELARELSKK